MFEASDEIYPSESFLHPKQQNGTTSGDAVSARKWTVYVTDELRCNMRFIQGS
ncbi:hypothetical protein VCR4J2_60036 [Vibrio coralliirubri]|nr:hypothetical protein VCR4J2_60036 [Vibrio coralliirubri]